MGSQCATFRTPRRRFTADGLDPTATHILKVTVTVTVTKNPSSQGNWASLVDAIIA